MKSRDGKFTVSPNRRGGFRVRFYCEDNKRQEKWIRSKTDRDALVRAIKRRESLDYWYPSKKTEVDQAPQGTFQSLAEEWMSHGQFVREISDSCLGNYRCHLDNHILPILGDCPLQGLRIQNIEQLAEALKKTRPRTRSYVRVVT